jgi:hypothetical protein
MRKGTVPEHGAFHACHRSARLAASRAYCVPAVQSTLLVQMHGGAKQMQFAGSLPIGLSEWEIGENDSTFRASACSLCFFMTFSGWVGRREPLESERKTSVPNSEPPLQHGHRAPR